MKTKEKITLIRREFVENEDVLYKYELLMNERQHGVNCARLYFMSVEMKFADGSVTVAGENMTAGNDDLRNRHIGYIFQNYNPLPFRCRCSRLYRLATDDVRLSFGRGGLRRGHS